MDIEGQRVLGRFGEPIRAITLRLRETIAQAVPAPHEIALSTFSGATFGFRVTINPRTTFCYINLERHFVDLGFPRGYVIPDPAKVFRMSFGSRYLRFREVDEVNPEVITPFVLAAVRDAARRACLSNGAFGGLDPLEPLEKP